MSALTFLTIFTPLENFRRKIFLALVHSRNSNTFGKIFNYSTIALIIINIAAVILETVKPIYQEYQFYFKTIEAFTLAIFTFEYFLQLWICTLHPKYSHPILGRLKWMTSFMAVIELLVILPFFISLLSDFDLRFISILRFLMVLRIFKLDKYSEALDTFKYVLEDKKEELLIIFFSLIVLLILSSCMMYAIESEGNPGFSSIPVTMWWAISTLTTVGYGDVVPATPLGKIFGSIISIIGIAMFAIPAGLISSSFTEFVNLKKKKKSCPHCKNEL